MRAHAPAAASIHGQTGALVRATSSDHTPTCGTWGVGRPLPPLHQRGATESPRREHAADPDHSRGDLRGSDGTRRTSGELQPRAHLSAIPDDTCVRDFHGRGGCFIEIADGRRNDRQIAADLARRDVLHERAFGARRPLIRPDEIEHFGFARAGRSSWSSLMTSVLPVGADPPFAGGRDRAATSRSSPSRRPQPRFPDARRPARRRATAAIAPSCQAAPGPR